MFVLGLVMTVLLPLADKACGAEQASPGEQRTLLVIGGAGGEEEFATEFNAWAENWKKADGLAKAKWIGLGWPVSHAPDSDKPAAPDATGRPPESDREKLGKLLEAEAKEGGEFWLVLIGHGTFNGREAKFNLRGPDVSAQEIAEWLKPFRRPLVLINCSSASSPFMNALAGTNRVLITATRSGHEVNYARFGKYLSEAISDTKADLDKDGQTSLLEGFIFASKQAETFYKNENRLASEHALIDDNSDGFGTQADWFRGVRATKKPPQGTAVDGFRAHQIHLVRSEAEQQLTPATRARRDEIEVSINQLREQKAELKEDEYYARLEKLLIELAGLYEASPAASPPPAKKSTSPSPSSFE